MNNTQRPINEYKNGQKTGYWNEVVSSNPTFKTVSYGKYKNGERIGLWIEHDDSGYIISKGHYKLGKKGNKVGVLIKDRNTRKRIQEEHTLLKKKSIMEIKNYLKERNLIKVGSEAPNDVVRHMYEQAVLCGDVENMSKDALVHNFLNDA